MKKADEIYNLIGQNMKKIRINKIKMSQEKMAAETDLSRSFISHIESPKVDQSVSVDTLFFLAQKYNFDIREFFNDYEKLMNNDAK